MKQNNNSGDSAEPILRVSERIAVAVAGKTTFEEKRIAIKQAKLNHIARAIRRRGPGIIAYLQSCDGQQSSDEILDGIDRLERQKRSMAIKRLCKDLVLMDEIRGEKIEDTWYFSKKGDV